MISLAKEALVNISKNGEVHYTVLANIMKISPYYAHLICRSLSKDDYIVINSDEKCDITPKGTDFLKDKSLLD